jgi:hypothetical protein
VLETPSPEDSVVAAARLHLDSSKEAAVIEYLCSIGDNIDELNGRFLALLTKIESIAYSQNYHNILVNISSWRDDTQRLLTAAHYADIGGCLDESHASLSYTKPSMILCFKKELKPFHSSNITTVAKQKVSTSQTSQTLKECSADILVECTSVNNLSSNRSLMNIPGESSSQHAECSTISHEVNKIENKSILEQHINTETITTTPLHAKLECSLQKMDFDFSVFHTQERIIFNDFQNNSNSVESSGSMEGIVSELFSALRSDKAFLSE